MVASKQRGLEGIIWIVDGKTGQPRKSGQTHATLTPAQLGLSSNQQPHSHGRFPPTRVHLNKSPRAISPIHRAILFLKANSRHLLCLVLIIFISTFSQTSVFRSLIRSCRPTLHPAERATRLRFQLQAI